MNIPFYSNAGTIWMQDECIHREDGPAIIRPDGTVEFWLHGHQVSHEEFNFWLAKKTLNERLIHSLHEKEKIKETKL